MRNFKELVLLLILLILFTANFTVRAMLPCECKEDRILQINNPLMTGGDVKLLQGRLQDLGYNIKKIDGIYDQQLAKIVAQFQKQNQLNSSGIVEVNTWQALAAGVQPAVVVNNSQGKEPDGEIRLVINTYKRTLTLYNDDKPFKTYPVAIGKPSTKTPIGEWAIIHKSKHWGGGFGTRWMGLNVPWGIYGIHGTNKPWSIGSAASHGCIRMYNRHVEELYEWVPLKTRVNIIGERLPITVNRVLHPGEKGLSVMQLQDNLKKYGFEPSYMDARYGPSTTEAVKELEAHFNLKVDGIADWNVLYILNLPEE